MKRTYTLFVTDDELLASPYVRRFNFLHDITLHLGQKEEVNFLLQEALGPHQRHALKVEYDTVSLELQHLKVLPFKYQTLITANITPKELGSIRITFSYPHHVSRMHRSLTTARTRATQAVTGNPYDWLRLRKQ